MVVAEVLGTKSSWGSGTRDNEHLGCRWGPGASGKSKVEMMNRWKCSRGNEHWSKAKGAGSEQ